MARAGARLNDRYSGNNCGRRTRSNADRSRAEYTPEVTAGKKAAYTLVAENCKEKGTVRAVSVMAH
ncbi:MAG: hypothetical protein ACLTSZ_09025 [Lachnospiraceae bacterium]